MTKQRVLIIAASVMMFVAALVGGLAVYIAQADPANGATPAAVAQPTVRQQGGGGAANIYTYPVSSRRAALIALRAAPGASLLETPSLVSFQGGVAYEVQLDSGLVYIDAFSGQVVYNGTKPKSLAPVPSVAGDGGEGELSYHN